LEGAGHISWTGKLIPDLVLYAFSLMGFVFLPAHFGRKIWLVVGWFVGINILFIAAKAGYLEWQSPWLFSALGMVPWILVVFDLIFDGQIGLRLRRVPMEELILWQVTRLMGIHYVVAILGNYAPRGFALEAGFSEVLTGVGALVLYISYTPGSGLYRTLLIFWNTYGLTSALVTGYRVFLSNPDVPFARYSREIFQYMTDYPQNWVYCFWLPLSIGMHAAVFHKIYKERPARPETAPSGG
jgi:hypothetical protein